MIVSFNLHSDSSIPLYQQLAGEITSMIETGSLTPGSRLPSSRELAGRLGVSRTTVARAYGRLAKRGLIVKKSCSGNYVKGAVDTYRPNTILPGLPPDSVAQPPDPAGPCLSRAGKRMMSEDLGREIDAEIGEKSDCLCPAGPTLSNQLWIQSTSRVMEKSGSLLSARPTDPRGLIELRVALSFHLRRSRSVAAPPESIVVFSSSQIALDCLVRLILDEGETAIVEDPGFPGFRRSVLANAGLIEGIPVDALGINTSLLNGRAARLAYVTPSHQSPRGVALSDQRRKELLIWATKNDAFVIEDDFGSEPSYAQRPQPPLKSIDSGDRVIFVSSFWSFLFPLTRIAYAIAPGGLLEPVRRIKEITDRNVPLLEQLVLADLLDRGILDAHICRTRREYRTARSDLIRALNQSCSSIARISPSSSGLNLLITVSDSIAPERVLTEAERLQLPMVPTTPFYIGEGPRNEFLFSFADLSSQVMEQRLSELGSRLKSQGRS
ncbi:MAG: PLP-dependent aminotransferase family protein [Cyanobacteria bacterium HKST-UBA02]|nr:PLP-dependent aminotransferase family protein [Cyanobacteria bacterium HKST-UBA02]